MAKTKNTNYIKMIFIPILVLLAAVVIIQLIFTFYSFSNSGDLVKNAHTGKFERGEATNPEFALLIDGDSVAAGVGASSFDTSLAGRVAEYYAQDKHVFVTNQAVSGSKMGDLIDRKIDGHYDVAFLVISSNDLFRFTDINLFKQNTEKVLVKYSKTADRVVIEGPGRIYDATAVPFFIRPLYLFKAKEYSRVIDEGISKYENITHADPTTTKLKLSDYGNALAKDNFHPNDKGVMYWFDITKPYLK